jgi:hypothetical protein
MAASSGSAAIYFLLKDDGSSDGFTAYQDDTTKYLSPDTNNVFDLGRSSYMWANIFGMYYRPGSSTDAAAPNNSIYYSTTQSKLVYKDSGGSVNDLY